MPMAKQPVEQRDRFRIFAETSSEAMGPLLAQLTRMGLENIGYELITDVVTFGTNGPRKVHETTGDEFAKEWIKENPTFKAIELVDHFRASDRTPGSAYSALKNLVANGDLRKLGPGAYQRADVQAIEPPKAGKKATKDAASARYYEVSNFDLIKKHFFNRRRFKVIEARELFLKEGRPAKSVSSLISQMHSGGLLKQVGRGEYEPVKKKEKTKRQPALAPSPNLNGAGAASNV